jgi:hypothetical protein
MSRKSFCCPYDGYKLQAIVKPRRGYLEVQDANVRLHRSPAHVCLVCPFCGHERIRPLSAAITNFIMVLPPDFADYKEEDA